MNVKELKQVLELYNDNSHVLFSDYNEKNEVKEFLDLEHSPYYDDKNKLDQSSCCLKIKD